MKKKIVIGLLAMTLTASMLTGCGESSSTESGGTESSSEETSSESSSDSAETETSEEEIPDAVSGISIVDETADFDNISDFITIGEYKMELTKDESVDTSSYGEEIAPLVGYYHYYSEDTPAELGMTATLDYAGTVDGEALDGMSGEDQELVLGSGSFIDDFEEQLVGAKIGEEVVVNVTFPENYSNNEDLSGKDAVFTCTIKGLKRGAWDLFVSNCTVNKVPKSTYSLMLSTLKSNYEYYASQNSMSYDDFIAQYGITEESIQENALSQTKQALAAIAIMSELGYDHTSDIYTSMENAIISASGYDDKQAVLDTGITEDQIAISANYYTALKALLMANGCVE